MPDAELITELQPYPEYKDSDNSWLAIIPKHWELRKMKYLFTERVQKGYPSEPLLAATQTKGVVLKELFENRTVTAQKDLHLLKLVKRGDYVISLRSFQGGIELAHHKGIISPAYTILVPKNEVIEGYFRQVFKSRLFIDQLKLFVTGIREGQNIDYERLSRSFLPYPPAQEQQVIGNYLDRIELTFNRYILSKQHLITLLNERKLAIISHAVTRGLNPNVHLKQSGIEWLGEVPEHWDVMRLRNVATLIVSNVDKHSKLGEIPIRLCNYTDVYKNDFIHSDMPFMCATASEMEIDNFRIHKDDVIITKDSEEWEDIGVPAYVVSDAPDLVCGYHLAIIRPHLSKLKGRFLHWQLMGKASQIQFSVRANGVTRYGLSHSAIKDISLVIPPLIEQSPIVDFVDVATSDLNHAIFDTNHEISLLQEYRNRLISDIITGTVDVRGVEISKNKSV